QRRPSRGKGCTAFTCPTNSAPWVLLIFSPPRILGENEYCSLDHLQQTIAWAESLRRTALQSLRSIFTIRPFRQTQPASNDSQISSSEVKSKLSFSRVPCPLQTYS